MKSLIATVALCVLLAGCAKNTVTSPELSAPAPDPTLESEEPVAPASDPVLTQHKDNPTQSY